MKLHPPFAISARLKPALKINDAWLSYDGFSYHPAEQRFRIKFILDLPDGTEHVDEELSMPIRDVHLVEVFETFLCFLAACAESLEYRQSTGREGDNEDLFPPHVAQWALENKDEIELLRCNLKDFDTGQYHTNLIEEN